MNARSRSWLVALLWVGGAALVAGLLIFALAGRQEEETVMEQAVVGQSQLATPPAAAFDSPLVTPVEVWPTLEPTLTPPPTPTIPPPPTWPPTPMVTRVPVAKPPFIPLPYGEPQPYFLVTHDAHTIHVIDSANQQEHAVLDTYDMVGLYPVDRTVGEWEWASPSPDGRQLALVLTNVEPREEAFLYHQGPVEFGIYLYDMAKGSLELLIEDGVRPVWSPDGGRIAYSDRKTQGLWIIDLATGERFEAFAVGHPETEHQADWFTWSPDGASIAVVKNWSGYANAGGIWIVEAVPNGEQRQVVPMEMNAAGLEWSPIRDEVLFSSSHGERLTPEQAGNFWIVDAESSKYRQLTWNMGATSGARIWSPDGKWLVFAAPNLLEGEPYQHDLWLLASNGQTLVRLNDDPISDLNPAWTPDGLRVVFLREDNGIWEVDLRTGAFEQMSPEDSSFFIMNRYAD